MSRYCSEEKDICHAHACLERKRKHTIGSWGIGLKDIWTDGSGPIPGAFRVQACLSFAIQVMYYGTSHRMSKRKPTKKGCCNIPHCQILQPEIVDAQFLIEIAIVITFCIPGLYYEGASKSVCKRQGLLWGIYLEPIHRKAGTTIFVTSWVRVRNNGGSLLCCTPNKCVQRGDTRVVDNHVVCRIIP